MTASGDDGGVPRLALSLREAAAAISVSERTAWGLAKNGKIPCVRVGSRVLVPVEGLRAWLAAQAGAQRQDAGKVHP